MNQKYIIALIIGTILFGIILIIAGMNPMIALIGVGITWFIFYFLWSPPPKHKDFSDRDRLEATSRAMGGSGGRQNYQNLKYMKRSIIKARNKSLQNTSFQPTGNDVVWFWVLGFGSVARRLKAVVKAIIKRGITNVYSPQDHDR
jgi:hypothetical protein